MKDHCSRCRCRRRRWIDFPPFKPSGRSAPHVRWAAKIKATRFASMLVHTHASSFCTSSSGPAALSHRTHIMCHHQLRSHSSRHTKPLTAADTAAAFFDPNGENRSVGRSGGWSPLQVGCAVYVIKLSCWIGSHCPLASGTGGGSGSRNRVCKA